MAPNKESQPQYSKVDAVAVVDSAIPSVTGVAMVEVVAPASLPEGYTFEAQVGDDEGDRMMVTVPKGGVSEGQKFLVEPSMAKKGSDAHSNAPVGHWKDGLCDCCVFGCCHPMCCLAYWCNLLAVAQVMTRMHLNWCGSPGSVAEVSSTFKRVAIVLVLYLVSHFFLTSVVQSYTAAVAPGNDDVFFTDEKPPLPPVAQFCQSADSILILCFCAYTIILILRTRARVRSKYGIPERSCHGCEDFCCAFWCGACATCQMARHTANYELYAAQCCTETGLPPGVEVV